MKTMRIRDICFIQVYFAETRTPARPGKNPLDILSHLKCLLSQCSPNFSHPTINARQYHKFSANFRHTQLFNHINSNKVRVTGNSGKLSFYFMSGTMKAATSQTANEMWTLELKLATLYLCLCAGVPGLYEKKRSFEVAKVYLEAKCTSEYAIKSWNTCEVES